MCKEARTVTRGAGGETHPLEKFSSSLEKRVGQKLKLLDIVQIFLAPHRRIQGEAKGSEDPPKFFQIRFLTDVFRHRNVHWGDFLDNF